jgi:putative exporter of polyketide antibiotics
VAEAGTVLFNAWIILAVAIVLVVLAPGLRDVDWVSVGIRLAAIAAGTFSALARTRRRSQ